LVDDYGYSFTEQIAPGAFQKAIDTAVEPIQAKVNHERVIGDTKNGLYLIEDSIGLYARAEVTDAEIIDKAAAKKLRGWSFGFICLDEVEEHTYEGATRRIVKELDLKEVSIIDDQAYPAYAGTSIKSSADDTKPDGAAATSEDADDKRCLRIRALTTDIDLVDSRSIRDKGNYDYYNQILDIYGGKKL